MRSSIAVLTAALVLSGCATSGPPPTTSAAGAWTPQVDAKGASKAKYEQDLAECRTYAQANPETDARKQTSKGLKKGGLLGAAAAGAAVIATGGLVLLPSLAVIGAAPAAVYGVEGKGKASEKYKEIVTTCLQGRGYNVIG